MGRGEGWGWLAECFLGCQAGLCGVYGILVTLGGLWASCSLRGGFVGWSVPVPESRKWQAGGGAKGALGVGDAEPSLELADGTGVCWRQLRDG